MKYTLRWSYINSTFVNIAQQLLVCVRVTPRETWRFCLKDSGLPADSCSLNLPELNLATMNSGTEQPPKPTPDSDTTTTTITIDSAIASDNKPQHIDPPTHIGVGNDNDEDAAIEVDVGEPLNLMHSKPRTDSSN